jgi:hypothetical protein
VPDSRLERRPGDAGAYIRAHSAAADRIFVWGQSPVVYDDAQRRPASRYIATFPPTGHVFGPRLDHVNLKARLSPAAWPLLEHDLRRYPPAFIVDTEAGPDAESPMAQFPVMRTLIATQYQPVWRSRDVVIYRRGN